MDSNKHCSSLHINARMLKNGIKNIFLLSEYLTCDLLRPATASLPEQVAP